MGMIIDGEEADRQRQIFPMATYKGLEFPIYLDDFSQIKLSVEQDEVNPVISVDTNGMIHALRDGEAVLIGEFAGMTDKIQVTVEINGNPSPR